MSTSGSSSDVGSKSIPSVKPERKTRSCAECRRRRIRCDGLTVPCGQCVYYQVIDRCFYPQRKERRAPTAQSVVPLFTSCRNWTDKYLFRLSRAYDELCQENESARSVLQTLFPGQSVDSLQNLSRDELLRAASADAAQMLSMEVEVPIILEAATTCDSPNASILGYEPSRIQEFVWDETVDSTHHQLPWEDDVNGMTALFDTESGRSYLGISSVATILHVMAHTSPQLRHAIEERKSATSSSIAASRPIHTDLSTGRPTVEDPGLFDAYFGIVHVAVPMIDEASFRQCYAQGGATGRSKGPWLALLNMVLTLGYIVMHDDSLPGYTYFADQAAQYLDMSCFATGHIYTLQALILYGGYYLHFLNKPNMASAVLGAAHRMALAMGLHYSATSGQTVSKIAQRMAETRTRTWWSLFCLDTWAGTTLGHPFAGVWPADLPVPSMQNISELDYEKMSLSTSAAYSTIAARIQDRMAQVSLIPAAELKGLDGELLAWHEKLHPVFLKGLDAPQPIRLAALVLRFRYLNLRMLLYRPYLLIRSINLGTAGSSSEQGNMVSLSDSCCLIAQETIDLIVGHWYPSQMLAWNASWFIFQATLVVLLRLLSSSISSLEVEIFEGYMTRALEILTEMRPWRGSAAQTYDLLQFIYSTRTRIQQPWETDWPLSDEDLMKLLGFSGIMEDEPGT